MAFIQAKLGQDNPFKFWAAKPSLANVAKLNPAQYAKLSYVQPSHANQALPSQVKPTLSK
jgi:hypothetical protein